jgi:1-acyl-sn-glycerol-3-phosphate acyltransferase
MVNTSYLWKYNRIKETDFTAKERHCRGGRGVLAGFFHMLFCLFLKAWFKTWNRLEITGLENLPQNGSYMLAANHASHLDGPALISIFPFSKQRGIFPVAAADYFFKDDLSTVFSAYFINAFAFERKDNAIASIHACREMLAGECNVLIVFPEGTRTINGRINDFKPGIGMILAGTGIPVVPVRILGTFERHPKGSFFPKPGRISIAIGKPVKFEDCKQDREGAEAIAAELQQRVRDI